MTEKNSDNKTADDKRIVPPYKEYWPNIALATTEQISFYYFWKKELEKGNCIDVEGNITYIFVYLYEIIPPEVEKFLETKNIKELLIFLEKLKNQFKEHPKVVRDLNQLIIDAFFYVSDFNSAWDFARKNNYDLHINDVINFRTKCNDTSIDGKDLLRLTGDNSGLTKIGKENKDEIISLSNVFLDNFFEEHGINFIEYFYKKFYFGNLTERDFIELRKFYTKEEKFESFKNSYIKNRTNYPSVHARNLFINYASREVNIKYESIPLLISSAVQNEIKRVLRESENILRKKNNLPKIGEGWISETALYYKIVKLFPGQNIIQHGRPTWLSPQHVDVYFPDINIAIEYQGAQHQRPVDFFGGEESFKKQQERDHKKIVLCKKNKCDLVHVFENYNIEEIKENIIKLLEKKSNGIIDSSLIHEKDTPGNIENESIYNDDASSIWKDNDFYFKKDGSMRVPKSYHLTRDYFVGLIEKIEQKRIEIKENSTLQDKKLLLEDEEFLKLTIKKAGVAMSLLENIIQQFNALNGLWEASSGKNEDGVKIKEVKLHCDDIADDMIKLNAEWKKYYLVEPSENCKELQEIVCEFYEIIFNGIKKFIASLNEMIFASENISGATENKIVDVEIKFDFTEIVKKYEYEILRIKRKKPAFNKTSNSKGSGCLSSVVFLSMLFFIAIYF